jgi:hypothetical protein
LPEQKTEAELIKLEGRIPIFARLLLTALVIVIISELIGTKTINVGIASIVLLPMLYAVVMGMLITPDVLGKSIAALEKVISSEEVALAGPLVTLALLPLGVKYGFLVGPAIGQVVKAGPAFILQELGNLGTVLIGLPIALMLGLRREAIGATVSICREPTLGIIAERYGINSPEGTGVLATYLVGTILGTIFYAILGSIATLTKLHPYALAMACGMGSASMMTASASALAATVPEMADTILAYAATSNMLTGIDGVYAEIFLALPLVNWLYAKIGPKEGGDK